MLILIINSSGEKQCDGTSEWFCLAAGKNVKVKLSLCYFFNWAQRHEGVLGEWRYSFNHSL